MTEEFVDTSPIVSGTVPKMAVRRTFFWAVLVDGDSLKHYIQQKKRWGFLHFRYLNCSGYSKYMLPLLLFGGFNPSEKYARQIGSFPQIGLKIINVWNHHPGCFATFLIPLEVTFSTFEFGSLFHYPKRARARRIARDVVVVLQEG